MGRLCDFVGERMAGLSSRAVEKFHDIGTRKHQKEAGCRIGRGGNVDADELPRQVRRHLATRLAGEKRNGPGTLARVLDQQRLGKCMATAGEQGVGHLFDAGVDAANHGNAVHQLVPLPDPPLAKHVGDKDARGKYDDGHQDHTEARHVTKPLDKRVDARDHRIGCPQHRQEDAVEHAHQPHQDVERVRAKITKTADTGLFDIR
mgnify:CR=1 FL=1